MRRHNPWILQVVAFSAFEQIFGNLISDQAISECRIVGIGMRTRMAPATVARELGHGVTRPAETSRTSPGRTGSTAGIQISIFGKGRRVNLLRVARLRTIPQIGITTPSRSPFRSPHLRIRRFPEARSTRPEQGLAGQRNYSSAEIEPGIPT